MNVTRKSENPSEIKKLGTILAYIFLVLAVVYLITTLVVGGDDFFSGSDNTEKDKDGNTKIDEAMDYQTVTASQTFSLSGEYYVVFLDVNDKKNDILNEVIKETTKKLYIVDLSKAINSSVVGEVTNAAAQSADSLQVSDPTLIKVSNSRNVLYIENFLDIARELKSE